MFLCPGYSVMLPSNLIRPILFPTHSVNQSAPSGPVRFLELTFHFVNLIPRYSTTHSSHTHLSGIISGMPQPQPHADFYCPACAKPISVPLVCGDCHALICRDCGTPVERIDDLGIG